MSWFHQLSAGKSWRPTRSSVSWTRASAPGFGAGDAGFGEAGEVDGAAGLPPQAASNRQKYSVFRTIPADVSRTAPARRSAGRNLFDVPRLSDSDGTV